MYFSFSVWLVFWDLSVFATELLLGNFPKNFIFKEKYWENGNGANFSSSSWNPQFLSFKIGLTKATFKALTQSFLVGYRRQSLEKLWKNFFFPTYLPRHMEETIYNVEAVILVTRLMLPLEDNRPYLLKVANCNVTRFYVEVFAGEKRIFRQFACSLGFLVLLK